MNKWLILHFSLAFAALLGFWLNLLVGGPLTVSFAAAAIRNIVGG
jgi:hypothetical protein